MAQRIGQQPPKLLVQVQFLPGAIKQNQESREKVTVQPSEVPVGVIASPERAKQSYKKTASSLSLLAVTLILPRAELLREKRREKDSD